MLHMFVRQASDCDPLPTKLTEDVKQALVAKHNEYRSMVASGDLATFAKASNMKTLVSTVTFRSGKTPWKRPAQATADKCDGKTREKTASALDTGSFTGVHQNIGEDQLDGTSPDVGKFVDSIVSKWYDGSASFKPADLESYTATTDNAGENFAQAKGGNDPTGKSKAEPGSSAVAIIGINCAVLAVGGVIAGLVVMRRTRASRAVTAEPAAEPAAAHASAGEEGPAAGSHEAAAGDAAEPKGAEAEKTAEAHGSPVAGASHEALAPK
ncbi:hypothetical protein MRX96_056613 [Rhipicephalus microplus]